MSRTIFEEVCDKCGRRFDILREGQYINQKVPRCYNCQPKTRVFIKRGELKCQ